MNCDSEFFEIFRSATFLMPRVSNVTTVQNNAMKEIFFSEYKATGFCYHCQKTVTVSSETLEKCGQMQFFRIILLI